MEKHTFYDDLYPFTWTRRVSDIRVGILTLAEKWALLRPGGRPDWVPENVVPDEYLAGAIGVLGEVGRTDMSGAAAGGRDLPGVATGGAGVEDEAAGVAAGGADVAEGRGGQSGQRGESGKSGQSDVAEARKALLARAVVLRYPWDIFLQNDAALRADFALLTRGRVSQPIPASVQVTNPEGIFIEAGAVLEHVILHAGTGPIYIGAGATIMDGAVIRGPFAACEGAVVKMGAKIYGATTLGPYCSAGGELKNVVMFGYSNKAHEGYLGDAVIGEWCNLGAGTTASNVKNNAGDVKVWHQASQAALAVGLKCGLLMGDYSRAAINTAFNTGTVVGVAANVFGTGLTSMHVPSFSWGAGRYRLPEALEHIRNWKKLKNRTLSDDEIRSLRHIFDTLK